MTETRVNNPVQIFLVAIASVTCFSVMNVFVKLASEDASIAQILFFRNALAFFPIFYIMARKGGFALVKTDNHMGHLWRGIVGVASMVCFFTSFSLLPLAEATSLHFASPLILTALSMPLLGERVGKYRWGAVIIGLGAVFFMFRPSGDSNLVGSAVALLAALLAAVAMVFVRKLGRTEHAVTIVFYFSFYSMMIGAVAMLFMWQDLNSKAVFYLIMTGLIGGIGQIFLTYSYAHAPAAYVAPFSYLSIVFAILFDVMIWGVWPEWHILAGSTVIIASGLFIVFREASKKEDIVRTNLYGLQPVRATDRDESE